MFPDLASKLIASSIIVGLISNIEAKTSDSSWKKIVDKEGIVVYKGHKDEGGSLPFPGENHYGY